jgi:hypothetical protein
MPTSTSTPKSLIPTLITPQFQQHQTALGFIAASFPAYSAMETKTIREFASVSKSTIYIGVVMCATTGLFGYVCFRQTVEDNILLNFHGVAGGIFKVVRSVYTYKERQHSAIALKALCDLAGDRKTIVKRLPRDCKAIA